MAASTRRDRETQQEREKRLQDVRVAVSTRRDSETQQEREKRLQDVSSNMRRDYKTRQYAWQIDSHLRHQNSVKADREKIQFLRKGERGTCGLGTILL